MSNVYYDPEEFGLTLLGETDLAEPDYSFDLLAVWKGEKGYYLATDSGCSCPTPFENYDGISDLTGPLAATDAREEMWSIWMNSYQHYDSEGLTRLMLLVQ